MEECLVFFSGGKDSFITACMCIEQGYDVKLISFNNGSLAKEENILTSVERLQKRYGSKVQYVGCRLTAGWFGSFIHDFNVTEIRTICKDYPYLIPAQAYCLCCQCSMWIVGIAFASSRGIKNIAAGYRCTDEFCTGCTWWIDEMKQASRVFDVKVILPAFDRKDWAEINGFYRDNEMLRRGFSSAVLEPKCMLGCNPGVMNSDENDSLRKFYKDCISNRMSELVVDAIPIMKTYPDDRLLPSIM